MLDFRLTSEMFSLYQSKKCCFYQDKICFLMYIIFSKDINIKIKIIEIIKDWLKSKLISNIQVFLRFINFYQ